MKKVLIFTDPGEKPYEVQNWSGKFICFPKTDEDLFELLLCYNGIIGEISENGNRFDQI